MENSSSDYVNSEFFSHQAKYKYLDYISSEEKYYAVQNPFSHVRQRSIVSYFA
jgi:hypothetical protein